MSLKSSGDSNQIERCELKLELLLNFDWFLIEIGKYLISPSDLDLKNILCLNKKINEKATPIFKHHFLNFELQKQLTQLIIEESFDEIQILFQKHPYSLNPNNLLFNGQIRKNRKQRKYCVHEVEKQFQRFSDRVQCTSNCAKWNDEKIPLIIVASRFELNSLVRSILFHPRFDFNSMVIGDVNEVLGWSIIRNDMNIFKFIISKCRENSTKIPRRNTVHFRKNVECVLSELDIQFSVFLVLQFSRFEILDCLLNIRQCNVKNGDYYVLQQDQEEIMLDLSFERGGTNLLTKILNSNVFYFNLHTSIGKLLSLRPSVDSKSRDDYLFTIIKYDLEKTTSMYSKGLNYISANEVPKLMQLLRGRSNQDDGKLVLLFTFYAGLKIEFENQLRTRNWNDEDLLELLQKAMSFNATLNSDAGDMLTLVLNSFSEKAQIAEKDVNELLWAISSNLECVKLIWNDKKTIQTRSWTCQNFTRALQDGNQIMVDFFEPQVSMSEVMTFQLDKDLEIQTEVRNCVFLISLGNHLKHSRLSAVLDNLLSKFKIKWNEHLFDWSLNITLQFSTRFSSENISFFLNLSPKKSFWNDEKICNVFKSSLHHGLPRFCQTFPILLKKFPNVNLSYNGNNDCLRSYLSQLHFSDETFRSFFKELVSNFHFKTKEERKEFLEYAENWPTIRDILLQIEIIEM